MNKKIFMLMICVILFIACFNCSNPSLSENLKNNNQSSNSNDSKQLLTALVKGTGSIYCTTTVQIQTAMQNALPGDVITIAAGTYVGDSSTSGNSNSMFYSAKDGTSVSPIIIQSEDSANPAILKSTNVSLKYIMYLIGNYWQVKNLILDTGRQGLMVDNANNCYFYNIEIRNIGQEGLHLRDGSSNNVIDSCYSHDTGKIGHAYGEGFYCGSDKDKWGTFVKECDNNDFINCRTANTTAESIDIKEGTTGTIIEYCNFSGAGMCDSVNGGDSFIDAKGNNAIIRYNTVAQNGGSMLDAFEGNSKVSGWGVGTDIYNNTVTFDSGNTSSYLVFMRNSASAKVHATTRTPDGNKYLGNVTEY